MKNKIIVIFSILLILAGCGKKYTITPESLPIAHVNQSYHQVVNISGGKVSDRHFQVITNYPEDMGIKIQPTNDLDGYNIIEIEGTPKYRGQYSIQIKAYFYGGGDAEINKKYTFKVE